MSGLTGDQHQRTLTKQTDSYFYSGNDYKHSKRLASKKHDLDHFSERDCSRSMKLIAVEFLAKIGDGIF